MAQGEATGRLDAERDDVEDLVAANTDVAEQAVVEAADMAQAAANGFIPRRVADGARDGAAQNAGHPSGRRRG
ncbi:hypothetical protein [Mesorhizobium sp.]|uniref:hypothetical protein n=1 Tax=Mesorhizobium sp. TaxID=1871066 RepID=UPI0025BB5E92|nr:hypothetical protein [Mesorhizobium sp.]